MILDQRQRVIEARQDEARQRQEARAARTPREQLRLCLKRGGTPSSREVARLGKLIAATEGVKTEKKK